MQMYRERELLVSLEKLYRSFGFMPYKMSRFEEYDLYVKNKDFLLSDQVITFSDRSGRLLALKPDVTLSIIKNAPEAPGRVEKVFYSENVYRADKGTGSFREIMQMGLECVGDISLGEVCEVVLLAARSLSQISDRFILDLSHMGLVQALLMDAGLEEKQMPAALDCLRRKSAHELMELCALCTPEAQRRLSWLVHTSGAPDQILGELEGLSAEAQDAVRELKQAYALLEAQGFGDRVRLDFCVGSDMKYYSGMVFKGYVDGVPQSVLSGGQYDKLLQKMGRQSGAIGFAIYTDLLERLGKRENGVLDTVLLYEDGEDLSTLTAQAQKLRRQGSVLVCKTLPEGRSWGRVLKYKNGEVTELE